MYKLSQNNKISIQHGVDWHVQRILLGKWRQKCNLCCSSGI